MATANGPTFDDLKARARTLGLELISDDPDYADDDEREYHLLDPVKRTIVAGNHGLDGIELELKGAEHHDRGDLQRRVAKLGLELWIDGGQQLVLRRGTDETGPIVEFVHRDQNDDELADWLTSRESNSALESDTTEHASDGDDSDDDGPASACC